MSADREPKSRLLPFSQESKKLIGIAHETAREYQLSHPNTAHLLLASAGTEELLELFGEIGIGLDKIQFVFLPFMSYVTHDLIIHGQQEAYEGIQLANRHASRTGKRHIEPINIAAGLLQLPFSFEAATLRRIIQRETGQPIYSYHGSTSPTSLGIYRLFYPKL